MKDLKDLSSFFEKVEKDITSMTIKAQRETAEMVCEDARMLAPWRTREYEKSIHVTDTEVQGNIVSTSIVTDATVVAKVNGNEYNLGKLLEEGTKPHLIRPIDAKALHFQINGEYIHAKLVHHPGFEPYIHFQSALWLNEDVFNKKMGEMLDKEFK